MAAKACLAAAFRAAVCLVAACQAEQVESGTLTMGHPPPPSIDRPVEHLTKRDFPADLEVLRFGVTPYLGRELTMESYGPFTTYLADRLGQKFELVIADSYGGLIELVAQNKVDIFVISPLSYVVAKRKAPSIRILGKESAGGMISYSSYVVVREESRANSLSDLKGKRMAFVDEHSTSGFLFPFAAFLREGIDPFKAMKVCFSGSHIKAIKLLVDGDVDAIAISSNMLSFAANKNSANVQLRRQGFRILRKAGRIPYDALAVQGGFSQSGRTKIQSAFAQLNTRTPRGRQALAKTADITGWVSATDANYNQVRKTHDAVHEHLKNKPRFSELSCD